MLLRSIIQLNNNSHSSWEAPSSKVFMVLPIKYASKQQLPSRRHFNKWVEKFGFISIRINITSQDMCCCRLIQVINKLAQWNNNRLVVSVEQEQSYSCEVLRVWSFIFTLCIWSSSDEETTAMVDYSSLVGDCMCCLNAQVGFKLAAKVKLVSKSETHWYILYLMQVHSSIRLCYLLKGSFIVLLSSAVSPRCIISADPTFCKLILLRWCVSWEEMWQHISPGYKFHGFRQLASACSKLVGAAIKVFCST